MDEQSATCRLSSISFRNPTLSRSEELFHQQRLIAAQRQHNETFDEMESDNTHTLEKSKQKEAVLNAEHDDEEIQELQMTLRRPMPFCINISALKIEMLLCEGNDYKSNIDSGESAKSLL